MTRRDRRAVAAGALIIGLTLVPTRLFPSARAWIQTETEAVERAGLALDHAHRSLGRMTLLEDSLSRLEARADGLASRTLVGGDAQTAGIDLSGRLRRAIDGRPIRLLEFRRPVEEDLVPRVARVRIPVVLETDLQGAVELLDALHTDEAIEVIGLELTATTPDVDAEMERLSLVLHVAGVFQKDAVPTPSSPVANR